MYSLLVVIIFLFALGFIETENAEMIRGVKASLCRSGINGTKLKCCVGYFERNKTCLKCPDGTFGDNCSSVCPEGLYGPGCGYTCTCQENELCYPATGCTSLKGVSLECSSPKSIEADPQYTLNINGERFSVSEIVIIFLLVLIIILIAVQMAIGRIRKVKKHITAALDGEVRRRQVFIPNRTFTSDDWSDNEFQADPEAAGFGGASNTETCQKTVYRSLAADNPYSNFEDQQANHDDYEFDVHV